MEILRKETRISGILLDEWHPYLWIVLAVLLVYFRTLFFGLTFLDDKDLIVDNYHFISNLSNIPQAFMSRVFPKILAPYYRPLLIVTFMLDAKIGGTDLLAYHITNILIHICVCCMLFRLLTRLGFNRPGALFFSLCFAVHPALAQAVAWVPGRNDSLLALFALASFMSFLNYLDKRRRSDYALHLAFFTLGLFTKETAIMIAAVCLLYLRLIDRNGLTGRELRSFALGWIVAAGCWYVMRQAALKGSFESTAYSLASALWVSSPAFIQYIGKVFMPFNLSVFPIIRDTAFIYGIAAILLLFFALRHSKLKRWPFVIFGLSWFFLFLAPSFLRPSAKFVHDFQEHRMYLPVIGIAIVLNEIDIVKRISFQKKTLAACAVILSVLAAVNVSHASNFMDRMAYWRNAVATSPRSWITHLKMGSIYYDGGSFDRAEQEYLLVLQLDRASPQYRNASSAAYAGLGHVYMAKNMMEKAEVQFRKAIASYPANYPVYVSLGTVYYRQGRLKEASAMWVEALKYEPADKDALRNMAILCAEQKDFKAALFYVDRLREAGVDIPADFLAKLKNG